MSQEIVPQPTPQSSEMFAASSEQMRMLTTHLITRLPDLQDAELLHCARFARELGQSAFLIRGAVAAEIRRRYPSLSGRRRDVQGAGRKALLKQLAAQFEVSLRMLEEDATIFTTFVACADGRGKSESALTLLPLERDFYRFALQAPDPYAAIRHAILEKEADPSYRARAFRAYVRSLCPPKARKSGASFRREGEGISLSVKVGKKTDPQVALAFLKQAVHEFEEQLPAEAGGREATEV